MVSSITLKNLIIGYRSKHLLRAIASPVHASLQAGELTCLIGANGEGKSTFMNIVTGKLQPDEGKVEWSKNVRVGYLDQHAVLEKGMTIEDVLKSAFGFLFDAEAQMNEICEKMGDSEEPPYGQTSEEVISRLQRNARYSASPS